MQMDSVTGGACMESMNKMTLDEAIELTEIRKKMVQSQCESCWSEDAEIGLQCMYLVRDLCNWLDIDDIIDDVIGNEKTLN